MNMVNPRSGKFKHLSSDRTSAPKYIYRQSPNMTQIRPTLSETKFEEGHGRD